MKAVEFDQKFNDGKDITKYLDLSKAKRSRSKNSKFLAMVSIEEKTLDLSILLRRHSVNE
jgi:hypothetical protein